MRPLAGDEQGGLNAVATRTRQHYCTAFEAAAETTDTDENNTHTVVLAFDKGITNRLGAGCCKSA